MIHDPKSNPRPRVPLLSVHEGRERFGGQTTPPVEQPHVIPCSEKDPLSRHQSPSVPDIKVESAPDQRTDPCSIPESKG